MTHDVQQIQERVDGTRERIAAVHTQMQRTIVGQHQMVNRLLVTLFARGHLLLEGVPGLAKTTAIATLAKALDVTFQRIQFTPDLLPSDIVGSRVFNPQDHSFFIKRGPVFANFLLADEINRSPAKVQSALLEAMQERQVTIGDETFPLIQPFLVMATQNPLEQEGTYALPEAQVDRFLLKTVVSYPTVEEELGIIDRTEHPSSEPATAVMGGEDILAYQRIVDDVFIDDSIKKYIVSIVFASRAPEQAKLPDLKPLIHYGASPRASIGLVRAAKATAFLEGRAYVIPEDVKAIAMDVLRHRVIPTYEAEAEGMTSEHLVGSILKTVPVP